MTHADRFATALQATYGLFVAFVLLLGAAYVSGRAWSWYAARPKRNRYAAPADVQAWRSVHWPAEGEK
jgi:hypothetical protein